MGQRVESVGGRARGARTSRAHRSGTPGAALVERLARRCAQAAARLAPGAGEAAIARFRAAVGCALPEAFYALYRWRNGCRRPGDGFCDGFELLSLERSAAHKRGMDALLAAGHFAHWAPHEWWDPAWVPFLDAPGGDTLVVDTRGGFGGAPGQVLALARDDDRREVLHRSFDAWLETLVLALERGSACDTAEGLRGPAPEVYQAVNPGLPRRVFARSARAAGRRGRQVEPVTSAAVGPLADAGRARVERVLAAPAAGAVASLAVHPDGKRLAVAQEGGWHDEEPNLSLLDLATGATLAVLDRADCGRERRMIKPVLLPPGQQDRAVYLLSDGCPQLIEQPLDGGPGRVIARAGPGARARTAQPDAAFDRLLVCLDEVRVLSFRDWSTLARVAPPQPGASARADVWAAALSPDGALLALAAAHAERVALHAADGGRRLGEWPVPFATVVDLAFDPTGRRLLVTGDRDGDGYSCRLCALDVATGAPCLSGLAQASGVVASAFSPDGRLLAVGDALGDLTLFDLEAGARVYRQALLKRTPVRAVCFSPDGTRVLAGGAHGKVVVLSLAA